LGETWLALAPQAIATQVPPRFLTYISPFPSLYPACCWAMGLPVLLPP